MVATKVPYDFYKNDRFYDDPENADKVRKPAVCAPKIGTEPRMQTVTYEKTPGP